MKSKFISLMLVFICICSIFSSFCYADLIAIEPWEVYSWDRAEELGITVEEYLEEYKDEYEAYKNKILEDERLEQIERDKERAELEGLTLEEYYDKEEKEQILDNLELLLNIILMPIINLSVFVFSVLIVSYIIILWCMIVSYFLSLSKKGEEKEKYKVVLIKFKGMFKGIFINILRYFPVILCCIYLSSFFGYMPYYLYSFPRFLGLNEYLIIIIETVYILLSLILFALILFFSIRKRNNKKAYICWLCYFVINLLMNSLWVSSIFI